MPGNSRSGRRPPPGPVTREGSPLRPGKLSPDEAFFWDGVIAEASHLEAIDTSLCRAATRAWGLYCSVCVMAGKDPTDKDIKSAVSTYGSLLDKLCSRLAVDPLGRARQKPKRVAELDPLAVFMGTPSPAVPRKGVPLRSERRQKAKPTTKAKGRKKT